MLASSVTKRPTTPDELISSQLSAALDRLDLSTRRVFAGKLQGERRSKARGRSVEFEDFRPYVPGDDLRHIDWNVFARLDRLFIKIFQEEQDLSLHVVLDASASMDAGRPNKLIFAQRVAMALGYLGLVNNNRVSAWVFGGVTGGPPGASRVRRLPPMRGRTSVQRLAKFLLEETFPDAAIAGRPDREEASFTSAMRSIAASRSGRGVLVLLTDLFAPEGYADGLSLLAGGNAQSGGTSGGAPAWDITVIQTLSPGELDPESELSSDGGRAVIGDLRLTDAETGRAAEVTITRELVDRYLARFEAFQREASTFCTRRGIQHVVARSDADVSVLLMDELRRRGTIR
ncbi:MAG: DUF58 domain-containing protein [Phycisphaerales bacterium]|nr:DUF58 domain-containing protein [Phycisphaerales bacterium]